MCGNTGGSRSAALTSGAHAVVGVTLDAKNVSTVAAVRAEDVSVGVAVEIEDEPVEGLEVAGALDVGAVAEVVAACEPVTVWTTVLEVDPAYVLFPTYTAWMECVPAASFDVVKVACPVMLSDIEARTVVPSMNWTVPLGTPPKMAVTTAVKLTVCLSDEGLGVDVRAATVVSFCTVST